MRDKGGLEIGSLVSFNVALILKWKWRFFQSQNALWVRLIRGIYGSRGGFFASRRVVDGCSPWSRVVAVAAKMHATEVIKEDTLLRKVGNGRDTKFWDDCWIGGQPLAAKCPRLAALAKHRGGKVAEYWDGNSWKWEWQRPLTGRNLSMFHELIGLLGEFRCNDGGDRWWWNIGKDERFTVWETRRWIDERVLPVGVVASRWCRYVPRKVNICIWRIRLQRLPTRMALSGRGMEITSILCPSCGFVPESIDHLFARCDVANQLWVAVFRWLQVTPPLATEPDGMFKWVDECRVTAKSRMVIEAVVCTTYWIIWRYRNDVLHDNRKMRKDGLFEAVPAFDGHYEHWSEMMENLLRAKQVWNLIDPGIREPAVGIAQSEAEKKKLEELRIKDLQVKRYLYHAIDRVTFEQIMDRITSKAVWDSMKQRFSDNERVKRSMLQKLRRDFEILEMKNSETIPEYFVSIEESKDVDKMSIEELQSTLIVHEQKFKRIVEKEEDQALKLGHYAYESPNSKEANYAGFEEDEEVMLMAEVVTEENAFMADTSGRNQRMLWFLDSGCSHHMCGNKDRFFDFDSGFSNSVKLGNDARMMVTGKGNMKLFLNWAAYVINDVYYVPDLKNNFLSIGQLQQKGISFLFQSDVCKVFHQDKGLIFQSNMSTNRMFPISEEVNDVDEQRVDGCMYTSDEDNARLWHETMGHLGNKGMETLQRKGMLRDLPCFSINKEVCEDCMIGKQTKIAIPKASNWRADGILELIHSYICGPISPASHTKNSFKQFKKKVETETGKTVKALRTDRGGEYLSDGFKSFCLEHGIKRQLTTSFSPQQNGVAERKNRTVINIVVSMIAAKKMPKKFWGEATVWSLYVLNRCPTKALVDMTPEEAWSGIKPTVHHFRIWGCLAHVHIPKQKRTKLDNKSFVCILTGVSDESKAYMLIDPHTLKVIIRKDVIFKEHKAWTWDSIKEGEDDKEISWGDYDFIDDDYEFVNEHLFESTNDDHNKDTSPPIPAHTSLDPGPSSPTVGEGRHQRLQRRPIYLNDCFACDDQELNSDDEELNIADLDHQDPIYYEDAVRDNRWKKAMDLEIQAIEKNQTWRLVDLPKGTKYIRVKWVYKTKLNEKGEIEKHKARLVAKGYGQEFGVDSVEVYAPVARMDTIRLMIALAAQKGWNIYQMDVQSAFLHGTLEEDVYVQQPQGYVVENNEEKVYKLQKALYGLKQAPRAWFSRIEAYFIKEGFARSSSEHTLFIKAKSTDKLLFVNVYVDDLLYTGNDEKMLEEFKCSMKNEFEMTDLGRMRYFLGLEVLQTRDEHKSEKPGPDRKKPGTRPGPEPEPAKTGPVSAGIHVSQQKYAIEILNRFNMLDCNAVMNPIVPGSKLRLEEGEPADETLFKSLVGCLMYITTTRPDIQFVVSYISRFMSKPTEIHFAAAKRVLRYLQGTLDYGIWSKRGGKGKLEVFTDSDFDGDWNDVKSTSGYLVLWDGAAIAWSSKKQSIVALSSTEAEYVVAAACACQVIWIRGVLEELGMKQVEGTVIKCDNTSTIKLSKNPVFHGRCKHIGVKFHFLRKLVGDGTVELQHVGTREPIADIFTKPLHREVFIRLREKLGVCSLEDKQDFTV
ncbi:hypothetical protein LXL04_027802 [Taraxacum kok-saghyz]